MKKEGKVWGLCESCRYFKDNDCLKKEKNKTDLLTRESWPGSFLEDRCLKCQMYLINEGDYYV